MQNKRSQKAGRIWAVIRIALIFFAVDRPQRGGAFAFHDHYSVSAAALFRKTQVSIVPEERVLPGQPRQLLPIFSPSPHTPQNKK